MVYIGIIGTRRRDSLDDCLKIYDKLCEVLDYPSLSGSNNVTIVSGGCPKGGDRFAEIIAANLEIPIIIYPPDWGRHGKAAGFLRNSDIANKSDILIACVSEDRTGGTEDTIKKFLKTHHKGNLYLV